MHKQFYKNVHLSESLLSQSVCKFTYTYVILNNNDLSESFLLQNFIKLNLPFSKCIFS